MELPDSGGLLFTGLLSLRTQPWLADHVVMGSVVLPGSAFVELAVRAGDEVGCGRVEELTLQAPLLVPERGGVWVRVQVGEADASGCRSLGVYSRPAESVDGAWVRHADGVLASGGGHLPEGELVVWPPVGAVAVSVEGLYGGLAGTGLEYGPVFRGVRGAWVRGGEVFAEVALPEGAVGAASSFGVHPALLDAALHAIGLGGLVEDTGRARLPFSWSGVVLHAAGASVVRVRLARVGADAVSVLVADAAGEPVVTVDSLALRPVT
ncbi:polyketide synthase dehydratase domain-containing protein, partial [Streptomyces capparidis]